MRGKLLEAPCVENMRHDIWYGGSNSGCGGKTYGWGGAGDAYKVRAMIALYCAA